MSSAYHEIYIARLLAHYFPKIREECIINIQTLLDQHTEDNISIHVNPSLFSEKKIDINIEKLSYYLELLEIPVSVFFFEEALFCVMMKPLDTTPWQHGKYENLPSGSLPRSSRSTIIDDLADHYGWDESMDVDKESFLEAQMPD